MVEEREDGRHNGANGGQDGIPPVHGVDSVDGADGVGLGEEHRALLGAAAAELGVPVPW